MLFSFIVPVYNVEDYIPRCINSLIGQNFSDFEIILVNDGSTDNSLAICNSFAKQDRRIRVISKPNGGLSDARNVGIDVALGKYLVFVDSDDYVSTELCSKIVAFANEKNEIIVIDGACEGGNTSLSHISPRLFFDGNGKDFFLLSLKKNSMPMAAWLYIYKRSFLLDNKLFFTKGILHEDEDFTPRCLIVANHLINTGFNLYKYVIRSGSITQKKDMRKNASDLIQTCFRLEKIYTSLEKKYRLYFLDSLVIKYLDMFQKARLLEYGKEYLLRGFVIHRSYQIRTRVKAFLFFTSPHFYCFLNTLSKKIK